MQGFKDPFRYPMIDYFYEGKEPTRELLFSVSVSDVVRARLDCGWFVDEKVVGIIFYVHLKESSNVIERGLKKTVYFIHGYTAFHSDPVLKQYYDLQYSDTEYFTKEDWKDGKDPRFLMRKHNGAMENVPETLLVNPLR
jgi:hypothetical protein